MENPLKTCSVLHISTHMMIEFVTGLGELPLPFGERERTKLAALLENYSEY